MRRTLFAQRGAKGYNWYKKYLEKGAEGFKRYVPPTPFDWDAPIEIARPKAFFEIKIDNEVIGKLSFELAADVVPITVQNFVNLCTNEDPKYSYRNTIMHDIKKGITIMGGDIEYKTGKGGYSSFSSRYFLDENFIIPHTARGYISMASVGVNSNNSQYYISLKPATHLNGRSVVFGRIAEGIELLAEMEKVFTVRGLPARPITISDCGLIPGSENIAPIDKAA